MSANLVEALTVWADAGAGNLLVPDRRSHFQDHTEAHSPTTMMLRYQGNDSIQTEYIQGLRDLMKAGNTTIRL